MKRVLFALVCASTSAYGSAIVVSSASAMPTDNVVLWNQALGADQSYISQTFFASSSLSATNNVTGHLSNGSGTVLTAGVDWKAGGGISANDALLSTADSLGDGGAPVSFSVTSPIYGMGTYIQADGFSQFTARIQAFSGVNSVLDMTVKSDAAGDAIFLGVSDTLSEITRVVYSLMSAPTGYSLGDFALDSLYLQSKPFVIIPSGGGGAVAAPEPGTASLLALSLLAIGFKLKNRFSLV